MHWEGIELADEEEGIKENPFSQKTGVGLTFVGLAFISPMSTLSASNSSRFSYSSFIKDEKTENAAREAMATFRWQSHATSAVLGIMAYAATDQNVVWGLTSWATGAVMTELLLMDMLNVINKAVEQNGGGSTDELSRT